MDLKKTDDAELKLRSLGNTEEIAIDEEAIQYVVVTCGKTHFAFEGIYVKEILPQTDITFVPGLPNFFSGMIHVRGNLECVADLGQLIGLQPTNTDKLNRVLIVRYEEISSGILTEYVLDLIDVPKSKIRSDIKHTDAGRSDYFIGEFEWNNQIVVILDIVRLMRKINGEEI